MLLASDGSTTILLQAMLDEPLILRLDEVCVGSGAQMGTVTRRALELGPDTPVIVRRSALVTGAGVVVSRNHVVGRATADDAVGQVLTAGRPIGWTMNGARAGHRREILDAGWSHWEAGGRQVPCAFKSYVIYDHGAPRVHIVERFNPGLIPSDRRAGR